MKQRKNKTGLAMIVVMMALGILAVTTLGISVMGNLSSIQNRSADESDDAFFAARSGLSVKLAQLRSGDRSDLDTVMPNGTRFNVDVYGPGDPDVPWSGFTVPGGANTYYILAEGYSKDGTGGDFGKVRRLGMLVQKNNSVFNAAVVAGTKLQMDSLSFTDVFDSAGPSFAALDHRLASVALYDPSATVQIDSGAKIGRNGTSAEANLLLPPGFNVANILSGSSPGEFAAQVTEPLLADPGPIAARTVNTSAPAIDQDGFGNDIVLTPTFNGTEYVYSGPELKAANGAKIIFDISAVPNGEVAHFDVTKVILETGGVIEINDGGLTDAKVELYSENEFKIEGGSLVNPSSVPDRFQVFCRTGEVKLEVLSATYVVARSDVKATIESGSEIFGAVTAPEVVMNQGIVHYDKQLALGGGSGGSSLTLLGYHTHSKKPSRAFP